MLIEGRRRSGNDVASSWDRNADEYVNAAELNGRVVRGCRASRVIATHPSPVDQAYPLNGEQLLSDKPTRWHMWVSCLVSCCVYATRPLARFWRRSRAPVFRAASSPPGSATGTTNATHHPNSHACARRCRRLLGNSVPPMVSPIRLPITAPQNELRTPNLSQTSGPSAVSLRLLNAKQNPISKQIIPQKMPPGFRFMFIIGGSLSGIVCCPLRLETTRRYQQLTSVTQACRAETNHGIIGKPSRHGRNTPTGWKCVAQMGSDREPLSGATRAGPFALAENCFSTLP